MTTIPSSARINSGMSGFVNENLLLRSRVIQAAMTGNANFPDPSPSLVLLGDGITNFSEKMSAAESGSKVDRLERDLARKELIVLIKSLADYVTFTAQGDELILAGSGYEVAKTPQPVLPIGLPADFKVVSGVNSGEMKLSQKGNKNARMYGFQYTPMDVANLAASEVQWITSLNTKRSFVLQGLTPGVKYYFRVTMSGVRGQITYSNVIAQICL